jgi:hypothetical protein
MALCLRLANKSTRPGRASNSYAKWDFADRAQGKHFAAKPVDSARTTGPSTQTHSCWGNLFLFDQKTGCVLAVMEDLPKRGANIFNIK